nr:ribonuclease H-like domain-containing protein [Tanacetum cinerariifolium]
MNDFCSRKGIKREFSNARTPQQNGVAERRNRTLIEAARTMLANAKLLVTFWAEAVNNACYVQNRVLVNKSQNKTPYELFNGRSPAIGFLKPFGCHVMILNTLDNLGKFEAKRDEGYFIGADAPDTSGNSNPTATSTNPPADHMETLAVETPIPTISDALQDPRWVEAMQEELLQFKIQNVWSLVDYPKGVRPIGTKWVLKNKKNEIGIVIRNKARLVAQGHTQEEWIDYDEGKDRTGKDVDLHHYRSMIGSLMYLTASRPDIMFDVYACARHQVTPKECHLHAVKRIFRYLKGHPKLGLWYPKESPLTW